MLDYLLIVGQGVAGIDVVIHTVFPQPLSREF